MVSRLKTRPRPCSNVGGVTRICAQKKLDRITSVQPKEMREKVVRAKRDIRFLERNETHHGVNKRREDQCGVRCGGELGAAGESIGLSGKDRDVEQHALVAIVHVAKFALRPLEEDFGDHCVNRRLQQNERSCTKKESVWS